MDNAFQELDYSDLNTKQFNKRKRTEINTKTRGGLIRLGIMIIIFIIVIILLIGIFSKTKTLNKKEEELKSLKEKITEINEEKKEVEDRSIYLKSEMTKIEMSKEELTNKLNNIKENINKLENSNTKAQIDINNAKESISFLEDKLKEFEDLKNKIDELQKNTEFYQKEIAKIKQEP